MKISFLNLFLGKLAQPDIYQHLGKEYQKTLLALRVFPMSLIIYGISCNDPAEHFINSYHIICRYEAIVGAG